MSTVVARAGQSYSHNCGLRYDLTNNIPLWRNDQFLLCRQASEFGIECSELQDLAAVRFGRFDDELAGCGILEKKKDSNGVSKTTNQSGVKFQAREISDRVLIIQM